MICLIRETIGPFINRSTVPDETITIKVGENDDAREIVEVPARKFKSKEKLLGIRLCKLYSVIDKSYRYNSLQNVGQLENPVSAIFGDTVVLGGSDNAGQGMLPSRVLYSSSYSIRDRSAITERLTHNALAENGTMWDEIEGQNRTSLFETEYVIPGVYFPSFLTLIDPTPETLYFVMQTLKESSYGAQTSITGDNFKNNIVFILGCYNEPAISSYKISRDWDNRELNFENIKNFMIEKTENEINTEYKMVKGTELNDILEFLDNAPYELSLNAYKQLKQDVSDLYKFSKFGSKKSKKNNKAENTESDDEE